MIKYFSELVILIILIFISIEDVKTMTVPASGTLGVFLSGAFLCLSGAETPAFYFKGWLVLTFTAFITAFLSKGLGGGDVKLFSALGFALGALEGIKLFVYSFLLSGFFVLLIKILPGRIVVINRLKQKKEMPFVPFIAASAFLIFTKNLLYCL
ncbi:MAG: prepilin peptidase [Bacillota bacterium]|nr:prepilin peptidase [Bacillota bacterium]